MSEKKDKKRIFSTLLSQTIIGWLSIIFFILFIIFSSCLKPFPERETIQEMNSEMIEQGQAKNLMIMVVTAFIAVIFEFVTIVLSFWSYYLFFVDHNLFYKPGLQWKKSVIILSSILKVLFLIFFIVLSQILVFYLWLIYLKKYCGLFENKKFILSMSSFCYNRTVNKISFISTVIFIPTVVGISLSLYYSSYMVCTSKVRSSNLNKYLQLSNNHPNIMYFYFDRTESTTFNLLLAIDYAIDRENSFIKMFPEFTSYTNNFSLSQLTVYSNPSIYGGGLFNPWLKEMNFNNFCSNKRNSDMTWNEWYFYSLIQMSKCLDENNFSQISWDNIPYYGKNFNYAVGEMHTLQTDIDNYIASNKNEFHENTNIITMDNNKLAFDKFNLKLKRYKNVKISEQYAYDHLDESYQFKQTDSGVFNSFFNQMNHNYYNYKENGIYKTSRDTNFYFVALWQCIQQLKEILKRLKNEPFLNEEGKQKMSIDGKPISVYDKTLFVFLSDHGFSFNRGVENYKKILDYCTRTKIAGQYILSDEKLNKLNNFSYNGSIPAIMIKNFKYDAKNKPINENKNYFFDDKSILALSDIPTIIENCVNYYYGPEHIHNNGHSHFMYPDINLEKIPSDIKEKIVNAYLPDPLKQDNKTIRKFYSISPSDWRFYYNEKWLNIGYVIQFDNTKTVNQGVSDFFDNNNFRKYTNVKKIKYIY